MTDVGKRKKTGLPSRSDTGNAKIIAELFKNKLRYAHKKNRWLVWRKHWWEVPRGGELMQLAKEAVRERIKKLSDIEDDKERDREYSWINRRG
jgi:CRISPR/Cas system type I-B associated protein Csh2 (Cas7 group RAMP superfamily)